MNTSRAASSAAGPAVTGTQFRTSKRSRGVPWCRSAGKLEAAAPGSPCAQAGLRYPEAKRPRRSAAQTHAFCATRGAREERNNEANADQRDAGRRTARRHRRRPDPVRHRHRTAVEGTEEVQHLQGPHHPARTLPRSGLRRIRRRAPRLPAAEGNLPRLLPGGRRPQQGRPARTAARRPGSRRPGRQGRARQQGRRPDHVHLAGRPLHGADAELAHRRRRLAPHRGRRPRRAEAGDGQR